VCRETVMPRRKSMLGKRKNIPQPVPILPSVSTRKRGLGTGKETSYTSFKKQSWVTVILVSLKLPTLNWAMCSLSRNVVFMLFIFKVNLTRTGYITHKPDDSTPFDDPEWFLHLRILFHLQKYGNWLTILLYLLFHPMLFAHNSNQHIFQCISVKFNHCICMLNDHHI
jgi:hypothetical protein